MRKELVEIAAGPHGYSTTATSAADFDRTTVLPPPHAEGEVTSNHTPDVPSMVPDHESISHVSAEASSVSSDESAESESSSVIGNEHSSTSVASEAKVGEIYRTDRKLKETSVPSSPLARVAGFASLVRRI